MTAVALHVNALILFIIKERPLCVGSMLCCGLWIFHAIVCSIENRRIIHTILYTHLQLVFNWLKTVTASAVISQQSHVYKHVQIISITNK